jgi:hypothetical protein
VKVSELQALLTRFAKLHRDGGRTGKAKVLEDFSSVLDAAKSGTAVQKLVKQIKERRGVGQPR